MVLQFFFFFFNSLKLSIPFILFYPLSQLFFTWESVWNLSSFSHCGIFNTVPMLVVVESERTNMNSANEYLLNCYRLLKLCSPPAKLIITNITLVDLIKFFFFPSENYIKLFFLPCQMVFLLFFINENK